MSNVSYSSAMGSTLYIMVCTRLDISQAISVVSHYMKRLSEAHWEVVKWILIHLKVIKNIGIMYQ